MGTQVDPSEGGSDLPPDLPPRADVVRRIRSILKATPGLLSEDGLVLRGAAFGQQLRQEIPGFTGAHYGGSLIDLASEAAGRRSFRIAARILQSLSLSEPLSSESEIPQVEDPAVATEPRSARFAPMDGWSIPTTRNEFRDQDREVLALTENSRT